MSENISLPVEPVLKFRNPIIEEITNMNQNWP